MAWCAAGELVTWGAAQPAGHGLSEDTMEPKMINHAGFGGVSVIEASGGGSHSVARGQDGQVYTWGAGTEGQLGHNRHIEEKYPREVEALEGLGAIRVATGEKHTLILDRNGTCWAFGSNDCGQLGVGSHFEDEGSRFESTPRSIPIEGVLEIDAGDSHSALMDERRELFLWGSGEDGQLGLGADDDESLPHNVALTQMRRDGAKSISYNY